MFPSCFDKSILFNHMIASVAVKQPWIMWVHESHKSTKNWQYHHKAKHNLNNLCTVYWCFLRTGDLINLTRRNWCNSLQWRHNGRDSVSNHQPHHCLLSRLFRRKSKKTSKVRVTGLCVGNSPVTGEFPAQMASNTENVSIWWRHHVKQRFVWWSPTEGGCI